jgi:hypothetical protein
VGIAFLAAPIVWLAQLQVAYTVAAFACDAGRSRASMHVVAALAVGAVVVSMLIARRYLRERGSGERRRFLALGGIVLGVQFLAAILAQDLAVLLLSPCQ